MGRYYTGVGSRKTPKDMLNIFTKTAIFLEKYGFVLRSGGAKGADSAFEKGVKLEHHQNKEIFYASDADDYAMKIASQFHPAWNRCSVYAKKLHGRNTYQVIGENNVHSRFLICWTPDGCESHKTRSIKTGGTGTAISIAEYFGVPVYNLKNPESMDRLREVFKQIKGGTYE